MTGCSAIPSTGGSPPPRVVPIEGGSPASRPRHRCDRPAAASLTPAHQRCFRFAHAFAADGAPLRGPRRGHPHGRALARSVRRSSMFGLALDELGRQPAEQAVPDAFVQRASRVPPPSPSATFIRTTPAGTAMRSHGVRNTCGDGGDERPGARVGYQRGDRLRRRAGRSRTGYRYSAGEPRPPPSGVGRCSPRGGPPGGLGELVELGHRAQPPSSIPPTSQVAHPPLPPRGEGGVEHQCDGSCEAPDVREQVWPHSARPPPRPQSQTGFGLGPLLRGQRAARHHART